MSLMMFEEQTCRDVRDYSRSRVNMHNGKIMKFIEEQKQASVKNVRAISVGIVTAVPISG